ncbi:MAG TPA: alpha/beta hydrolase [Acidimicrobiales bacterium]|nr:alpha/beta hydrolase [Acidimicrobiales bacterium]
MVLVHGTRDRAASFDAVRRGLGDLDVTAYTRRGWATSAGLTPIDLDTHVDDLVGVLDDRPSVVVGHSWGGLVAIAAAIRRPDLVTGIGIWETAMLWLPGSPVGHREHLTDAIERSRRDLTGSADRRSRRIRFVEEASASLVRQFDLHELSVPCIVGVGGASSPPLVAALRNIAVTIGAEVVEVPGASHMAHRERPEAFAEFVRRAVSLASPDA